MDPSTDCPICFETYAAQTLHEHRAAPCCGQFLCEQCSECLQMCPFCREGWHGADDVPDSGRWLRENFPNPCLVLGHACVRHPILAFWGARAAYSLAGPIGTGIRTGASTAAVVLAEASPVAIGASVAGGVAAVGGVAIVVASRHQEEQALRLQATIRSNRQRQLRPLRRTATPFYSSAACLFEVLQWYLSPQKPGMPHVYHGSPWRCAARETFLSQVQELTVVLPPDSAGPTPSDALWGDITFCFALWLQYNPHTANWGTCMSYGSPPLNMCWHNRWREDLRNAVSDLAKHFLADPSLQGGVPAKEWACAMCLLGMLDHVLSWDVSTPEFGSSELIEADFYRYKSFCNKLADRFALAWGAAQAPPDFDADLPNFSQHVEVMAGRDTPEVFQDIW